MSTWSSTSRPPGPLASPSLSPSCSAPTGRSNNAPSYAGVEYVTGDSLLVSRCRRAKNSAMGSRWTAVLVLLAMLSAPLAAQDKPKLYRIGMLEAVPIAANNTNLVEFHKGLKELGHAEGQ